MLTVASLTSNQIVSVRVRLSAPNYKIIIMTFKTIPEFPEYKINENGDIWSTYTNKIISPYSSKKGYLLYSLTKDSLVHTRSMHRLLARVFLDLPSLDSELEVDHIDNNPSNNSLNNLKVLTKDEHLTKTLKNRGFNKSVIKYCPGIGCGKILNPGRNYCINCSKFHKPKNINITEKDIEELVTSTSWSNAAKVFGYSDNGLRKRYKSLSGKDPKELKYKP